MKADVQTLARGAGTLLVATLLGNALLLVLDVYVNGVLGNAGYGLFGAIKRVLQLSGFVVLLGMENAVIRAVATASDPASARGAVQKAALATVAASAAAAAALAALAGPFAAWVDPSPETAAALRIGALSLPFASLRMVAVSASQGWKVVTHRAIVQYLAWPVAQMAGVLLLAQALGFGVLGVMWAYTGAMVLGAALAVGLLWRLHPDLPRPGTGPTVGELLLFSWPLWVQGMVMASYTWIDQVLLAGLRSAEAAGVYGPVATLAPLFGLGLGALNGQFAPMIAEKHKAGDREGLGRLYRTVTRWALALAIPPLAVAWAAPEMVLGIWPNGSAEAVPALRITCAAQLFCTAVGSVNYLLIMAGFQRWTLWNGLPAVALNLGLSVALVPTLGVTGAAVANGVAMATANGLGLLQVRRALGIHPFDRAFFRPLIAGVPALAVAWAVGMLPVPPLLGVAIAGTGAAGVFLVAFRALGLGEDDRVVVDALRRKLGR